MIVEKALTPKNLRDLEATKFDVKVPNRYEDHLPTFVKKLTLTSSFISRESPVILEKYLGQSKSRIEVQLKSEEPDEKQTAQHVLINKLRKNE